MSHDPMRTWVLSLTGTVNAAHSQGWVQPVVFPSLHWYVRTRFCGKATTSYLLKLPLVFTKGGKKKKRNYFLPNLKRAALPPGPGTHPATDRPEHPRTHPKYTGWDRKTSAAHLQKCMAAPKANAVWAGITRKLKRKALCVISCIANTAC